MSKEDRILITTFTTWLPHQTSNASDDLLRQLEAKSVLPPHSRVLHQLPVCTETAYARIKCEIEQYQPKYVICCGMAERRQVLGLEVRATHAQGQLWTPISLIHLSSIRKQLNRTELSFDAGAFVCNGIYHALLKQFWRTVEQYSEQRASSQVLANPMPLFVHVPCLTPENQADLRQDFQQILYQLPSRS